MSPTPEPKVYANAGGDELMMCRDESGKIHIEVDTRRNGGTPVFKLDELAWGEIVSHISPPSATEVPSGSSLGYGEFIDMLAAQPKAPSPTCSVCGETEPPNGFRTCDCCNDACSSCCVDGNYFPCAEPVTDADQISDAEVERLVAAVTNHDAQAALRELDRRHRNLANEKLFDTVKAALEQPAPSPTPAEAELEKSLDWLTRFLHESEMKRVGEQWGRDLDSLQKACARVIQLEQASPTACEGEQVVACTCPMLHHNGQYWQHRNPNCPLHKEPAAPKPAAGGEELLPPDDELWSAILRGYKDFVNGKDSPLSSLVFIDRRVRPLFAAANQRADEAQRLLSEAWTMLMDWQIAYRSGNALSDTLFDDRITTFLTPKESGDEVPVPDSATDRMN